MYHGLRIVSVVLAQDENDLGVVGHRKVLPDRGFDKTTRSQANSTGSPKRMLLLQESYSESCGKQCQNFESSDEGRPGDHGRYEEIVRRVSSDSATDGDF